LSRIHIHVYSVHVLLLVLTWYSDSISVFSFGARNLKLEKQPHRSEDISHDAPRNDASSDVNQAFVKLTNFAHMHGVVYSVDLLTP
jgi:hypothetical protein